MNGAHLQRLEQEEAPNSAPTVFPHLEASPPISSDPSFSGLKSRRRKGRYPLGHQRFIRRGQGHEADHLLDTYARALGLRPQLDLFNDTKDGDIQ